MNHNVADAVGFSFPVTMWEDTNGEQTMPVWTDRHTVNHG